MTSLRRSARLSATPSASNGDYQAPKDNQEPKKKQVTAKATNKERNGRPEPTQAAKAPSTPKRRRAASPTNEFLSVTPKRQKSASKDPSSRPENVIVSSLTEPLMRLAEPHQTNAPLRTPGGSRVVAYADEVFDSSPSKPGLPRPTTTTGTLLEEACAHLIRVEPRLQVLIEKHRCHIFSPEGLAEEVDPFRSLTSGIMAQQVSGAAAKSIKNKFVALFNEQSDSAVNPLQTFPTPAQVADCDIATLRTAGLSQRKAEYIKGLAEKFASGELSAHKLIRASDEEVLESLTAVRGLGRWSVEMFACFGLKRMDVFSTGDLGVQRGMAAYLGKDVAKLKAKGGKWKYISEEEMLRHAAKFSPYRSLFMWYMWRAEGVDIDAVEGK